MKAVKAARITATTAHAGREFVQCLPTGAILAAPADTGAQPNWLSCIVGKIVHRFLQ
jgi:hypothetical protein